MVTAGGNLFPYTCHQCGSQFFRRRSLINERGGLIFCSRKCSSLYYRPPIGPNRILAMKLHEAHPDWSQTRIASELDVTKQMVNRWFRQGKKG
jgi:hypothetical protein